MSKHEKSYPTCVYHKNYDVHGDEENLKKHSRVVKSDEDLKKLGPDWDVHPSLKESVGQEKPSELVDEKDWDEKPRLKVSSKK